MEPAVLIQVVAERPVDGARDVTRNGVDRLLLASEPRGIPGVDKLHPAKGHRQFLRAGPGGMFPLDTRGRGILDSLRHPRIHCAAGGQPGRVPAFQQRRPAMSDPTQQPPEPRRNCPASLVIDHDLGVGSDAPGPGKPGKGIPVRQRVPAAVGRHRGREVRVEMGVECPREVAGMVFLPALLRLHQVEPAVHDHPGRAVILAGKIRLQGIRRDDGVIFVLFFHLPTCFPVANRQNRRRVAAPI